MVYFDRKTLVILRTIYRSGDRGSSWANLQKKYGEAANVSLLIHLDTEFYIVTQDARGEWIDFNVLNRTVDGNFRSYCTPKGNELLQRRLFDFWKWVIPTLISVAALVISAIAAIY